MFKTFACALLASVAFARGDDNGLGQDNAVSTVLIDDDNYKLTLHHYNSDNSGTYEFHGDLEAEVKTDQG